MTNQPASGLATVSPARRFYELDSLRGLAALTVVLGHFLYLAPPDLRSFVLNSPLRILVAGHQAVMLFFVLSGFVLTLPYIRRPKLDYPAYLVKRLCRIYLPYLAALVLAIAADRLSPPFLTANAWINQTWSSPISGALVLQHVLFIGSYDSAQFNTALWSLIYEMRISLVFPFIALAVLRVRFGISLLTCLLLWAGSVALSHYIPHLFPIARGRAEDIFVTFFYTALFIVGSLLARHLLRIEAWFRRLPAVAEGLLCVAFLICYGYSGPSQPLNRMPTTLFDGVASVGALGLIVLSITCGPIHTFLNSRAIHHLGKVSYSLYLVHGTVLFLLIHTLYTHIPLLAVFGLYLGIALGLTEIFYRFVELPAMALGRRLASKTAKQKIFEPPVVI